MEYHGSLLLKTIDEEGATILVDLRGIRPQLQGSCGLRRIPSKGNLVERVGKLIINLDNDCHQETSNYEITVKKEKRTVWRYIRLESRNPIVITN